ncbi:MAG: tRNA guanosine(34) transglycosylase Tgt [Candidatus Marinimicrobia bacterium]|nr:tRNA guanosine(34) transglycosylase Tgt [Candidatus Neomarinimicrobiota bacterium]
MKFNITHKDSHSSARTGILNTPHGKIHTPTFMPVGTLGTVKTFTPQELESLKTEIILGNTYHLYLKPGDDIVKKGRGLHIFSGWKGPMLTDSGGFQVFSLARLNKISDEGVEFQSHIDGSRHFFTPEKSMSIQRNLGADIIMAFDECPPGKSDKNTVKQSVNRTTQWTIKCVDYLKNNPPHFEWEQNLFPIVQGNIYPDLRKRSMEELIPYSTCGIAIGGLAVGEEKSAMMDMVALCNEHLPVDQPRYLMGIGKPDDIIKAVYLGVDMFDCVIPTRNGRNGHIFTENGILNIKNSKYKTDFSPVDKSSDSPIGEQFSKSYVRHLFNVNEILGVRIASTLNIAFFMKLMKTIRSEIESGTFDEWSKSNFKKWSDC